MIIPPEERQAVVDRYTNADGGKKSGWLKAPNGKNTNLSARDWVRVRTPSFKAEYGDWERLAKQNELEIILAEAIDSEKISRNELHGKMYLRNTTPEEIAEIRRQGGPDVTGMKHEITAKELHHALKNHGTENEAKIHTGNRQLTIDDIKLIPVIIDAPDEIKVQPHGKNRTSIIYGRSFENGKIEYVERVLETSNENKPRLTIKTVWVKSADTGVMPSTAAVYTPLRSSNVLFANGLVNSADIKVPLDENGEPDLGGRSLLMDEKNPLMAEQTGAMRDTVNSSPHKVMSPEKRAEYHEFVKSAWHEAVNHQKGAGQISQKDFALLHGKDGFVHAMNAQRIKHIYDRHGNDAKESRLGQVAIKESDFLAIPDILQTPSFIVKNIKHTDTYSILYGKHTDSGETYIYIEQISKKKRRRLSGTFYKIDRTVSSDFVTKNLKNNAAYNLSEIEIENSARGGGQLSIDGDHYAASAAAKSANPADTSLLITSPEKSSAYT